MSGFLQLALLIDNAFETNQLWRSMEGDQFELVSDVNPVADLYLGQVVLGPRHHIAHQTICTGRWR